MGKRKRKTRVEKKAHIPPEVVRNIAYVAGKLSDMENYAADVGEPVYSKVVEARKRAYRILLTLLMA